MRFAGRIMEWNDDKGFGFVVPNGGGARVRAHQSVPAWLTSACCRQSHFRLLPVSQTEIGTEEVKRKVEAR